jgi:hypothetical protein
MKTKQNLLSSRTLERKTPSCLTLPDSSFINTLPCIPFDNEEIRRDSIELVKKLLTGASRVELFDHSK